MISVDTFTDRMIFMGIGCVLGLVLGWVSRTMKYAREARNEAHIAREKVERIVEDQRDSGRASIQSIALISVVLLVAVSAFISGLASSRVSATQENIENSQACTESVLANLTKTLNERTNLNSEVSKADQAQNRAFLKIATISLRVDNPPTMEEQIKIVKDYRDKLNKYLSLLADRANNPYPKEDDYRNCLNKAESAEE